MLLLFLLPVCTLSSPALAHEPSPQHACALYTTPLHIHQLNRRRTSSVLSDIFRNLRTLPISRYGTCSLPNLGPVLIRELYNQTFYKSFRTDAVGSSFTTVLVNGGKNTQSQPGVEVCHRQFSTSFCPHMLHVRPILISSIPMESPSLRLAFTTGRIPFNAPMWVAMTSIFFSSTGGSPPFITDSNTPTNTNEPYLDFLTFILAQSTIPQTFSTSYGDDEQTVSFTTSLAPCLCTYNPAGTSRLCHQGLQHVRIPWLPRHHRLFLQWR